MHDKANMFWLCPNCKTLNTWERDICEKCLIALDNELQVALSYENVNKYKLIKFVTTIASRKPQPFRVGRN
ncbi:MAG: hypothetical protein H8D26_08255 [Methanomicrobia archaeon]|nr:hypothetical protein [Methanomicrobia archaeon]